MHYIAFWIPVWIFFWVAQYYIEPVIEHLPVVEHIPVVQHMPVIEQFHL